MATELKAMNFDRWVTRWKAAMAACERKGGDSPPLIVEPPADEKEIRAVERRLGFPIPSSFRKVLETFARRVECYWYLTDGVRPPGSLKYATSCQCGWSLEWLVEFEEGRKGWVESCLPNPNGRYDRVWHNKFSFMAVANGDHVAIDRARKNSSPVAYLSHDDGEGHGFKLGSDFIDFMDRWTCLGCPGPEDWRWVPFTADSKSYLDPACPMARRWLKWFGLSGE